MHGFGNYERSGFLTRITPELIDLVVARVEGPQPPGKRVLISGECGGAFSRVAPAVGYPRLRGDFLGEA